MLKTNGNSSEIPKPRKFFLATSLVHSIWPPRTIQQRNLLWGFSDRPWIRTWFSGVITYDHYADLKTISHFYLKLCLFWNLNGIAVSVTAVLEVCL